MCLSSYQEKTLTSSALGDNDLAWFDITGTINFDMFKGISRDYKLQSYKLDNVSANFITENIKNVIINKSTNEYNYITLVTNSTKALEQKSYIQLMVDEGYVISPLHTDVKYKVRDIIDVGDKKGIKIKISKKKYYDLMKVMDNKFYKMLWTFAKDDMPYTDINTAFHEKDYDKLKKVAKYCVKDCKLVNILQAKLETIITSMGMANVCHVPLSYIFLRGQGVKIFSLVAKKCREKGYLIPYHPLSDEEKENMDGYEGATVITPIPNIYTDPIGVLDYNSLYPQSMREMNLSHESLVTDLTQVDTTKYIIHEVTVPIKKKKIKKKSRIRKSRYSEVINENVDVNTTKHYFCQEIISDAVMELEMKDIYEQIRARSAKNITTITNSNNWTEELVNNYRPLVEKHNITINDRMRSSMREELLTTENENCQNAIKMSTLKYFNKVDGKWVRYGILPSILTELLNKRKETNNKMDNATDPFIRSVLNALQLAYKITANSLYGQTGAVTSAIFCLAIAACTTATGRDRLYLARDLVEKKFKKRQKIGDFYVENAKIIYGDTDSIFINFHPTDETGNPLKDRDAVFVTMECCKIADQIN